MLLLTDTLPYYIKDASFATAQGAANWIFVQEKVFCPKRFFLHILPFCLLKSLLCLHASATDLSMGMRRGDFSIFAGTSLLVSFEIFQCKSIFLSINACYHEVWSKAFLRPFYYEQSTDKADKYASILLTVVHRYYYISKSLSISTKKESK